MLTSLIAYLAAVALLTITPGADTLLVLRYAGGRGSAAGYRAALGIALGTLVWGAIVAVGVAALIVANPILFDVLRYAGAAYLVWLGLQLLLVRTSSVPPAQSPSRLANPFVSGLLTNLLNPKVGVFYMAFLPQFVPPGASHALFILLLAAIHGALGLTWFAILISGVKRAAPGMRRPAVTAVLSRLTGLLFVGFGAKLLLSSR